MDHTDSGLRMVIPDTDPLVLRATVRHPDTARPTVIRDTDRRTVLLGMGSGGNLSTCRAAGWPNGGSGFWPS